MAYAWRDLRWDFGVFIRVEFAVRYEEKDNLGHLRVKNCKRKAALTAAFVERSSGL